MVDGLEAERSDLSVRYLKGRERLEETKKDRDAWEGKAEHDIQPLLAERDRLRLDLQEAEDDAGRLAEALKMADRLLSVRSFDAPEDLDDLDRIGEALTAHDAMTKEETK